MPNYTFLNATGGTQTAASSTISGVEYPIVKIPDVVQVTGSIATTGLNNINSVIGTYLENAVRVPGGIGFFQLATRNDALTSITALGTQLSPFAVGPVGEVLTANAPINKWVSGTASILASAVPLQPIIAAQGSSIFTYITGVQIMNWSNAGSVLVALQGATASTIGYGLVEANDQTLLTYANPIKTLANAAFTISIMAGATTPSIYVAAQGFISKT